MLLQPQFIWGNSIGKIAFAIAGFADAFDWLGYPLDKKVKPLDKADYIFVGFVKPIDKVDYPLDKKVKRFDLVVYFLVGFVKPIDKVDNLHGNDLK